MFIQDLYDAPDIPVFQGGDTLQCPPNKVLKIASTAVPGVAACSRLLCSLTRPQQGKQNPEKRGEGRSPLLEVF